MINPPPQYGGLVKGGVRCFSYICFTYMGLWLGPLISLSQKGVESQISDFAFTPSIIPTYSQGFLRRVIGGL